MEQAQWEEDREPAAAGDSALRVPEHDIRMGRQAHLCAAQVEVAFPGEAAEAGYMEAVEAVAVGASRYRISLTPPMHSPLQNLVLNRK